MRASARRAAVVAASVAALGGAPWIVLFATNAAMSAPPLRFDPERCTRACHDHGCRHAPVLPAALTSDEGLFGAAVRGLRSMGRASGLGPARGYGVANIVVFCIIWPGLMLWLAGIAIWQRLAIRQLRRGAP